MNNKCLKSAVIHRPMGLLLVLFVTVMALPAGPLRAESAAGASPGCLGCHAASADKPVHAILRTRHGRIESGDAGCVSCHGASAEHAADPVRKAPEMTFGPGSSASPEAQVAACQGCHKSGKLMFEHGSVHYDEDLTCTSCHNLHVQRDPVLDESTQADVCYTCHARQRTQANLPYRHPIKEGRTQCSDCHNPHGSTTPFSLNEPTLNDTCYRCHAEKRGPYLFEHAPAAEDCSTCHEAHGAVNEDLLKARGPFLCQQCHAAAFHPSVVYSGTGLPSRQPNQNMLGKNCLNCHSQVHGSNHPSGSTLAR